MRKHAGFTLIELLVVIAIISILASMIFPSFARVRESARRASCSSNLKQIGLAIQQYTQDNDERLPLNQVTDSASPGPYGWADAIQSYAKSTQILQCISEPTGPAPLASDVGFTDYFYNSNLGIGDNISSGVTARSIGLASVTNPTFTVMNGDFPTGNARRWCRGGNTGGLAGMGTSIDVATPGTHASTRHLGGANYSFVDGHTKWFKGNDDSISSFIYDGSVDFATSGDSPTFRAAEGMASLHP